MRLAVVALWAAVSGCQALYGGLAVDNPDNCSRNGPLCVAPDETCNPETKLCEPTITLTAVSPTRASNVGGSSLTLRGKLLTPDLTVLINGLAATVVSSPTGTSDQLTVTVPPSPGTVGPVTIELVHPAGQRQQRSDLFGYYAPINLVDSPVAGFDDVVGFTAADFNGDGKLDLVGCSYFGTQIELCTGNGDGTFAAVQMTAVSALLNVCVTGDVNGDGKPDVLVVESQATATPQFEVLLNTGSGSFALQPIVTLSSRITDVALGDLNGDGRVDLWTADGNAIGTLLNDGKGNFGSPQRYPILNSSAAFSLTLGDVNGDGKLDALGANQVDSVVGIALSDGHGSLTVSTSPPALLQPPTRAFLADLNNDHFPDLLALETSGPGNIVILRGQADGSFGPPLRIPTPTPVRRLVVADFNGDAIPDLVWFSTYATKNFGTFVGMGDGTMVDPTVRTISNGLSALELGDFDGDQRPDVVINDRNSKQLHVLLNRRP